MPEWSIGTVSKTVVRASVPWVRIPPSPPSCFALTRFAGLARRGRTSAKQGALRSFGAGGQGCCSSCLVHRLCSWSVRKPQCLRASITASPVAATAKRLMPCEDLVRCEPSVAIFAALADMNFQLGDLTEAKENALKAVEADPREHTARVLLARVRTALDERDAALADFRAALKLARSPMAPAGGGPIAVPAHQALHNLEQLIYLEQVDNLALARVAGARRFERMAQRSSTSARWCRQRIPPLPSAANTIGLQSGRSAFVMHEVNHRLPSAQPAGRLERCPEAFKGEGEGIAWATTLTPETRSPSSALLPAIDSGAAYPPGYGRVPNPISALAAADRSGVRQAIPELLGGISPELLVVILVCQHRRPGVDIHADQWDISPQFLDQRIRQPAARWRSDWTCGTSPSLPTGRLTITTGRARTFAPSSSEGSAADLDRLRRERACCSEVDLPPDRGTRFAEGFENRRRNVTMLFRRTRS